MKRHRYVIQIVIGDDSRWLLPSGELDFVQLLRLKAAAAAKMATVGSIPAVTVIDADKVLHPLWDHDLNQLG